MQESKSVGRPRAATPRQRKQMFLDPAIIEKIKGMSADQVNALLHGALADNISTLKGMDTSHEIGELEVTYRPSRLSEDKITSSHAAAKILKEIWSDKMEWVEEFVLLLLDNASQPIGYVKLFQGGLDRSVVDSRIIFGICLVAQAAGFIISHNHPSGYVVPSAKDKEMTDKLLQQSRIMGIALLDHIIVSRKSHFSFKDHNLIY